MTIQKVNAVVLAAGDGRRLRGSVPTGLKPLIVVNGEALISRLVRQATQAMGHKHIVVVVSPTNAGPICDLLGPQYDYVVQPEPRGPGEALLRGLAVVRSDRTLVLAADNYFAEGTINKVLASSHDLVIGVRAIEDIGRARRFTRLRDGNAGLLISEEGEEVKLAGPWTVWCGPLVAPTGQLTTILAAQDRDWDELNEQKIGPHLQRIVGSYALVPCDAQDIGVPEELP